MDIRQLHYFITVVEEKTVTAAAEKLHMTQPPLTIQLHMLEEELGCKLFRRDGRNLRLTDAGRHMYKRAVEIAGMCDNAKREMNEFQSGTLGTLRIGVISSVRGTVFINWIKKYHEKYKNVKISVFSANTYQLIEKLQNREIDMAITRTPFAASGLETEFIKREEICAVGHKSYFSGIENEEITLSELSKLPLIIYRRWQKVIENAFEGEGLAANICCVNDDALMTLHLSIQKLGVGLLHPSAIPEKIPKSFKVMPLHEKSLSSEIALVCNDKKTLSEPAALFWKTALDNI